LTDLTKVADDIDGLADREIKAGGFKFTFASVATTFSFRRWSEDVLYDVEDAVIDMLPTTVDPP
jgi:hypothetical protein